MIDRGWSRSFRREKERAGKRRFGKPLYEINPVSTPVGDKTSRGERSAVSSALSGTLKLATGLSAGDIQACSL